jgi:hypothetical protein
MAFAAGLMAGMTRMLCAHLPHDRDDSMLIPAPGVIGAHDDTMNRIVPVQPRS